MPRTIQQSATGHQLQSVPRPRPLRSPASQPLLLGSACARDLQRGFRLVAMSRQPPGGVPSLLGLRACFRLWV